MSEDTPEEALDARVIARLAATERPAVYLHRSMHPVNPDGARSYLGGRPRLPAEVDWPRHLNNGQPLHFLAQIDCAEVNSVLDEKFLPEQGTLFFFADINASGRIHEPAGWMPPTDDVLTELAKRASAVRALTTSFREAEGELDALRSASDALPGPDSAFRSLIGRLLRKPSAGRTMRDEMLARLQTQVEKVHDLKRRALAAHADAHELSEKWPRTFGNRPVVNAGSRVVYCAGQSSISEARNFPEDLPFIDHDIGKRGGRFAREGKAHWPKAPVLPFRVRTFDRHYVSLDPWIEDYQAQAEALLDRDIAQIDQDIGGDLRGARARHTRHLMFGNLQDDNASPERHDEVMLLELASDRGLGFMFGDASVLRFHIPQSDLMAGNFDAAFALCY